MSVWKRFAKERPLGEWVLLWIGSAILGLMLGVAIYGILSTLFYLVGHIFDLHPHAPARASGPYHLVQQEVGHGRTAT